MESYPMNADIDADFSESKPDEHLEAIRQEHEPFLSKLEALAVQALFTGDWSEVYDHINFNAPEDPKPSHTRNARGE
jgi:hypothetical protein